MFRKPVQGIRQGDRAGVCVTGLDPELIERGLACAPGSIPTFTTALALIKRVRYYKNPLESFAKLHVSCGHATVMAEVVFFGAVEIAAAAAGAPTAPSAAAAAAAGGRGASSLGSLPPHLPPLTPEAQWEWQGELLGGVKARGGGEGEAGLGAGAGAGAGSGSSAAASGGGAEGGGSAAPDAGAEAGAAGRRAERGERSAEWQYAVLHFETPVQAPPGSLVIGSRLDADVNGSACRLAFHGRLLRELPRPGGAEEHFLKPLRLYKRKVKTGVVDRVESSDGAGVGVIGRGLFKKEVDMNQFAGLRVAHVASGREGSIEGAFGKAGKFKAFFRAGGEGEGAGAASVKVGDAITLRYKKYLYGAEGTSRARLAQGE